MKPTKPIRKIYPSKEEPLISRGHGHLGRHKDEDTVLIPLSEIRKDREFSR